MSKIDEIRKEGLIPVSEFAATRMNRRGYPATKQSVYMAVKRHKAAPDKVKLDFEYVDRQDGIWIVDKNFKASKKKVYDAPRVITNDDEPDFSKMKIKSAKIKKVNNKPVAEIVLESPEIKPARRRGEDAITYAGRVSAWKKANKK